jgi:hypothetical protein
MQSRHAAVAIAALAIGLSLADDPAAAQNTQQNRREVTVEVNTGRYGSSQEAIDEATRLVREWQKTQRPLQGYHITGFGYSVQTTRHQSWHHYIPIGFGGSIPGALWGTTEYSVGNVRVTIYEAMDNGWGRR